MNSTATLSAPQPQPEAHGAISNGQTSATTQSGPTGQNQEIIKLSILAQNRKELATALLRKIRMHRPVAKTLDDFETIRISDLQQFDAPEVIAVLEAQRVEQLKATRDTERTARAAKRKLAWQAFRAKVKNVADKFFGVVLHPAAVLIGDTAVASYLLAATTTPAAAVIFPGLALLTLHAIAGGLNERSARAWDRFRRG